MSDIAIRVENLGKQYRLHHKRPHDSIKELIVDRVKILTGQKKTEPMSDEMFWALKDVSFELRKGEVLGVIGRNGAGKSTLLKILSRITDMTEGAVDLFGRIGSLLEIGTGFHPELTGRENIFLNGAIMGMTQAEVRRKFDAIVDFSEIEKFLDTPVKHYSSGMYTRLAFAVAAHLEPEILIVDEVLAVGDGEFQRKCLGKMGDVARGGRTIIFVSHNLAALNGFCNRAIWLDHGTIRSSGETGSVIHDYVGSANYGSSSRSWTEDDDTAPDCGTVRIIRGAVLGPIGNGASPFSIHSPILIEFDILNRAPGTVLHLSIHILSQDGVTVLNTVPFEEVNRNGVAFPDGIFRSGVEIPGDLLNDGLYRVTLVVVKDSNLPILKVDDILSFEVLEDLQMRQHWFGKWPGVVRPQVKWSTCQISEIDHANPQILSPQATAVS